MIPQTLLNVIQTGGKFFLDLDPVLTEHVARHFTVQIAAMSQSTASSLLQFTSKLASGVVPFLDDVRSIKLQISQS
jgi:hypothetical protein